MHQSKRTMIDPDDTHSLPSRVLELFQEGNYSGHGRKQTDVICEAVGRDILSKSDTLLEAAQEGELVAERNYTPSGHSFYHDVDYVVGTPTDPAQRQITGEAELNFGSVDDVWFALNVESLVSSVSKNWKNRGKEIHSFYLGVYDTAPLAATGSVIVLNVEDLSRDPDELINGYREFEFADGSIAQSLDSLAIIPIRYDEEIPREAELETGLLTEDDELHYSSFTNVLSGALERRFRGEFRVSPDSVETVLSRQESDVLEFKEQLPDHREKVAQEVAALANYEGGSILIGVDDSGTPVGLDSINQVEETVANILSEGLSNVIRDIEKARVDGADILIINVDRATAAPVDVGGTFFVRTGTTTDRLTGREILDRFPR